VIGKPKGIYRNGRKGRNGTKTSVEARDEDRPHPTPEIRPKLEICKSPKFWPWNSLRHTGMAKKGRSKMASIYLPPNIIHWMRKGWAPARVIGKSKTLMNTDYTDLRMQRTLSG
jgi:hypothetical protein